MGRQLDSRLRKKGKEQASNPFEPSDVIDSELNQPVDSYQHQYLVDNLSPSNICKSLILNFLAISLSVDSNSQLTKGSENTELHSIKETRMEYPSSLSHEFLVSLKSVSKSKFNFII